MNIGNHDFWVAFFHGAKNGVLIVLFAVVTMYVAGSALILFKGNHEDKDGKDE